MTPAQRWELERFRTTYDIRGATDGHGNYAIREWVVFDVASDRVAREALDLLRKHYGHTFANNPFEGDEAQPRFRGVMVSERKPKPPEPSEAETLRTELAGLREEIEAARAEAEAIGNWLNTLQEKEEEHEHDMSRMSLEKQRLEEEIEDLRRIKRELQADLPQASRRRIELE